MTDESSRAGPATGVGASIEAAGVAGVAKPPRIGRRGSNPRHVAWEFGRLLRYVIRARDGLNVNPRIVAIGAAAPYFYARRRGQFAPRLEALARRAGAAPRALARVPPDALRPLPRSGDAAVSIIFRRFFGADGLC